MTVSEKTTRKNPPRHFTAFQKMEWRGWTEVLHRPDLGHCWEYNGAKVSAGYGAVSDGGSRPQKAAHRLAYEAWVGPIPEGQLIRHTCDNPPCINPSHLETGTWSDNMWDKVQRERGNAPLGERHGTSKLTENQVREIRDRYASGSYTYTKLAEMYGITFQSVGRIVTRKGWTHVA